MPEQLKPNRKHQHLFAILRYETDADESTPIDLRITVKKIVCDPQHAEREVKRLNDLNKGTGCHYFYQITRLDEASVEVHAATSDQVASLD
jgi:hypothetical protein